MVTIYDSFMLMLFGSIVNMYHFIFVCFIVFFCERQSTSLSEEISLNEQYNNNNERKQTEMKFNARKTRLQEMK